VTAALSWTLPAQPATGSAVFIPLAGSGRPGPLGYYQINASLDDAATTGYNSIQCFFDLRYCHVVSHIAVDKTQATVANAVWNARVTPTQAWMVDLVGYDDLTNIDPQISDVRVPELEIVDGDGTTYIQSIIEENAIGDTHTMKAVIYVFDKNIRNTVPLQLILSSLGGR